MYLLELQMSQSRTHSVSEGEAEWQDWSLSVEIHGQEGFAPADPSLCHKADSPHQPALPLIPF